MLEAPGKNTIHDLLHHSPEETLQEACATWLPADFAELMEGASSDEKAHLLQKLPNSVAAATFSFLPLRTQKELMQRLPAAEVGRLLDALAPDDRTALLSELPDVAVSHLLDLLSNEERRQSVQLLSYPEESVGRLMTPDYLAIKMSWTVKDVLDYIRQYGRDSETVNILYVVDDAGKLIDDLPIREFLFATSTTRVEQISDRSFISLKIDDTIETALKIFRKYFRSALPVIDHAGLLVGIVTVDDILELSHEEDTEDTQKFGGMSALDEPYLQAPFFELMRKRLVWLVLLFFGEMFTYSALSYFEAEISHTVALALFIPLILSSGGNSGSQAATLVTRSIALGEVQWKDKTKVLGLELRSGLFLGLSLAVIGFIRVGIGALFHASYVDQWLTIAMIIACSLVGVVSWATFMGAFIPLTLRRLGLDPATSSTPLIATFVDVTGLILYFMIAKFFIP